MAVSVESSASSYTLFESGQVRPLVLSADGKRLFAANTPDGRVEVFHVGPLGLTHLTSIPVGMEPVALALRDERELWVVNHLSDSVSVVQLSATRLGGRVTRTLLVGDEPRDIVFAGPSRRRAFITTAHRGQNNPNDPQLTTPGVGRADVWVFDADNLGASLGGTPLSIVTLFTDTPRALAVSPNGQRVYAAGFHSGNRTTTVFEPLIPDGFGIDGVPGPATNVEGLPAPEVGLILQFDGSNWVDTLGRTWDDLVKFNLPDKDVFVIDAMANPPAQVAGAGGFFTGVGTILYNMAVNPVSGKVYVSNTEALNLDRFEGPGIYAGETLRGHLHESRISVLTPGAGSVTPRHLNKHIDYDTCCAPLPNGENAKSLALPQSMVISPDGSTLYVAALGSSKVGVFSTSQLEGDTFVPSTTNQIQVSGGGPTGLALDQGSQRLYVLTRFDNAISVVNTSTKSEIAHVPMYNPEPSSVTVGRPFLYEASTSSSHGDSSCASCHVYGDFDSLAWDLGNPDAEVFNHPGPFIGDTTNLFTGLPTPEEFHPMKGPMVTQSLRGMANHGAMHWRGDKTGGNDALSVQPNGGSFDEHASFMKFREAYVDLLGRASPITVGEMESFADFILQVKYPPNPIRPLNNTLTVAQQAGSGLFDIRECAVAGCETCHTLDPGSGFFGGTGASTFDFQTQMFKVPHLRNVYQKVGMFGMPEAPGLISQNNGHMGDQVRGTGFLHDGAIDTVYRFMLGLGFSVDFGFAPVPNGFASSPAGDAERRQIEQYMLAFDTDLAPIVGQQITLTSSNDLVAGPRIDLLVARADLGECDLIVKTQFLLRELGYLYIGSGQFAQNRVALPPIGHAALKLLAKLAGRELTYTCVPPGSGVRAALDRDEDGFRDGDELDAFSNPADPSSTP
ncbi:YncE family protein [Chondromyces crocatus]|nr:beta-propeller fold lactonase family protein [Chondromyces crocatus]